MILATLRLLVTIIGFVVFLAAVLVVILFMWAYLTPMRR